MIVKNVTKVHILKTLANSPRVLCIVYHPEGLPAFFDYTNTLSLPQGDRKGPHPAPHRPRPYNENERSLLAADLCKGGGGVERGGDPCGRPGGCDVSGREAAHPQGDPRGRPVDGLRMSGPTSILPTCV